MLKKYILKSNPAQKIIALSLALLIQSLIFFLLPALKYFEEKQNLAKYPSYTKKIITKINLTKPKQKIKKINQRRQQIKPKSTQTSSKRYQLNLDASGSLTLNVDSQLENKNIVYNQEDVETLPIKLSGRSPIIPNTFLGANLEGNVEIEVEIDETGAVRETIITSESPSGYQLAQACINAIRTWKFRPAFIKGLPVKIRVIIPFQF